jgi:hypothetical protein
MDRKYQAMILCMADALIDATSLVRQYKPKLTWRNFGDGRTCEIDIEQNGESLYPFEVDYNDMKIVIYKYSDLGPLSTYMSLTLNLPEGYNVIVLFIPFRTIALSPKGSVMSTDEFGTQVVLDPMEVYAMLKELIVGNKFSVKFKGEN